MESIYYQYDTDTNIHVALSGTGQVPVVLLHGFGASWETWSDITPELTEDARLYKVDLKGCGLSSKPRDERYAIEDHARIIRGLISHLKLREFTLVGHSYGGAVALNTMFLLRDAGEDRSVRGLVLIDAVAYPQALPSFFLPLKIPLLSYAVTRLLPPRVQARYTLRRMLRTPGAVTDERVERYARYWAMPGSAESLVQAAAQVVPDDVAGFARRIEAITRATLIIWGECDPVVPSDVRERLLASIRGSTLVMIDGCGHVPHEEAPIQTARALRHFLQ